MALQILPYLLTASMKKCGVTDEITILVATSGDTGKAALEGFADVEGTRIIVFYPENGVSDIQKMCIRDRCCAKSCSGVPSADLRRCRSS